LHNKICILGSTKTSEELWSLSTTLWRLWIPQRNIQCLAWYLKWWQEIRAWQILPMHQRNMRLANPSMSNWQKVASKDDILNLFYLLSTFLQLWLCIAICFAYAQWFYVCFLFTYTFPKDVKNEIFDFFTLFFKGSRIKAVELWTHF
jgi:hypothetical protein